MELSEKIKSYCEQQGYTQEELDRLIDVSHVSISLYEQENVHRVLKRA